MKNKVERFLEIPSSLNGGIKTEEEILEQLSRCRENTTLRRSGAKSNNRPNSENNFFLAREKSEKLGIFENNFSEST